MSPSSAKLAAGRSSSTRNTRTGKAASHDVVNPSRAGVFLPHLFSIADEEELYWFLDHED